MRHIHSHHLAPEMAGTHDQAARHHPVMQDLLPVVNVVDEQIERADALLHAALERLLGQVLPRTAALRGTR